MRMLKGIFITVMGLFFGLLSQITWGATWWTTTFATPSTCTIAQNTTTHTCLVTFSWGVLADDDSTGGSSSPISRSLYVNGVFIGSGTSGTFIVALPRGENTYDLVSVKSGTLSVRYDNYTPFMSFSASTHNTIVGDYNGNGVQDNYLQPLLKTGQNGLMPVNLNEWLNPNYHIPWTGIHPDISTISDWSAENYGAFSANLGSSPGDELLLLGKKKIILVHGDIIIPILLPKDVQNAIVSWNSSGVATFTSFDMDADPNNFVVHFGDFNGDGYQEILLQGKSSGSTSYILNSNGSLKQTIVNGYKGLDWSAATYDLVIGDLNGDGRDDLQMLSKVAGVADNFAYSNVSGVFDSVDTAYYLSESPKPATLVGSTGGQFNVNESGAATYNIPLALPAGTANVVPSIALNYSSAAGNGPLGLGWNISGLSSIHRCAENYIQNANITAVTNTVSDRFCIDGQQLSLKNSGDIYGGNNVEYVTEVFSHNIITSFDTDGNAANGPEYFKVVTRAKDVHYYGKHNTASANALVKATHNSANKNWLIARTEDLAANYISYQYAQANGGKEHYIDKILYTGNDELGLAPYNSIDFIYADELNTQYERSDSTYGYSAGSEVSITKLLKQVQIYTDNNHLKTWQIYHQVSVQGEYNQVKAIQECSYLGNCFEPVSFEWSEGASQYTKLGAYFAASPDAGFVKSFDLDGSGVADLLSWKNNNVYLSLNNGSQFDTGLNISATEFLSIKPIDLGADGKIDLISKNVSWRRWVLNSSSTGFSHKAFGLPSALASDSLYVVDLDGDGRQDLLNISSYSAQWYRQEPYTVTKEVCETEPGVPDFCRTTYSTYYFTSTNQPISFSSGTFSGDIIGSTLIKGGDESLRFSDFNGDGVTDLTLKAETISADELAIDYPDPNIIPSSESAFFAFIFDKVTNQFIPYDVIGSASIKYPTPFDLNRDGLTDILYVSGSSWFYKINRGGGAGFAAAVNTGIPASSVDKNNEKTMLLDYDNDGQAEFWVYTGSTNYQIYSFNGSSFVYMGVQRNIPVDPISVYADLHGNGTVDVLMASEGSNVWSRLKAPQSTTISAPRANLITRIIGAYGTATDITYRSLSDSSIYTNTASKPAYPNMQLTIPMAVVSSVASDTATYNAQGVEQRVSVAYQYEDLRAHLTGRGLLGFKKLTTIDNQSGIITETQYRQDFPFIGMPLTTTRKLSNGTVLSEASNTWAEKDYGGHPFPYLSKATEKNWTLNSDATPDNLLDNPRVFVNQVITNNTYDETYGNLINSSVLNTDSQALEGAGGEQWFLTATVNNFGTSVYEQKYARLKSSTITKSRWDVTGNEVDSATFNYFPETHNHDGSQFSGYSGMLESETSFPSTDKTVTKQHAYDAYGNKTREIISAKARNEVTLNFDLAPSNRSTVSQFDARGRYVSSVTNDLGHTESYTYEPLFGGVSTQTDPNGFTSSFEYNEVGTRYEIRGIDGAYTREYLYLCGQVSVTCPSKGLYFSESKAYDAADVAMSGYSRQFYNKMGQAIVTTKQTFDGNLSVARIEYDKLGRVTKSYMPNFGTVNSIDSRFTETKYDALGRVYQATAPGNRITTRSYTGLSTKTTNAIAQQAIETNNINAELLSVTDNANKTITYTYNSKGQFLVLTDSLGNEVVNVVDYAGHKTSTDDLDKGLWTYQYNGFGELIRQQDARGIVTTQEYDVLGRLIRRVDNAAVTNHVSVANIDVQTTCWIYDTAEKAESGIALKGALHKTILYDGTVDCSSPGAVIPLQEKIAGYDLLGRAESSMQNIKAEGSSTVETYLTMSTFEANSSRVEYTILPREVTLKNHYDAYGNMFKVTDGADESIVYRTVNNIDKFGNVVDETIGYGASTVLSNRSYNGDTGYLDSIISGTAGSLINFSQGFDKIGNVTSRNDHISARNEVFGYAEGASNNLLNRMTTYTVNGTQAKSYGYDELGNLKSKSDMGNDYRYGAGAAGVHAVTSIWNSGTQKRSFSYDLGGNLTNNTDLLNSANNRSIQYAAFEKPVFISKGSSNPSQITFRYGSSRERYRRIDNLYEGATPIQVETTYMGAYEKVVHTGGAMDGKTEHKYYLGGVALKIDTETASQTTSKLQFLHKDHLGSVVAISDENGQAIKRFRYDPFGKQYEVALATPFSEFAVLGRVNITERGFTGHEMLNSVDIIHMNGRIYDANVGRFLQADPYIQAPKNMQSMNRYSYVLNNPMSYTDPSGYFVKKLLRTISGNPILNAVASGLAYYFGGPWGAAAYSGAVTWANGGNLTAIVKNAAIAYASAEAFEAYGGGNDFTGFVTTGAIGGVISVAGGGKFGRGFAAAGVGSTFGSVFKGIKNPWIKVLTSAIVGGTASKISGGKFANGAVTAAFAYVFREAAKNKQEQEPQGRVLTADEISEAQSVYGDTIDYSKVRILNEKYVFFQGENWVMAPDGNIYWPSDCANFVTCQGGRYANTFIHEMAHVYQYQQGINVLGQGFLLQAGRVLSFGLYDPYQLTYQPGLAFSAYNIEQQGQLAVRIYQGRVPNIITGGN